MEVNRLTKDELSYELRARGLKEGSKVDEMRMTLRASRNLERLGSISSDSPHYPFSFSEDAKAVRAKILEIRDLLHTPPRNPKSLEYQKVITKIEWALGRISRAKAESSEEVDEVADLRGELLLLMARLSEVEEDSDGEAHPDHRSSEPAPGLGSVPAVLADRRVSSVGLQQQVDIPCDRNPERMDKWNVKFSGEHRGSSVNSFIERIEELREARGVSEAAVFRSAVDLFTGKALLWFRAIRCSVSTWKEVVRELKLEFLPPNYDDLLLDEVRRRTQGKDESIGMYIALMQTLFKRFSEPLSESRKLSILMKNIAPFYQTQLGLADIKSVSDLVALGRKLETIRANVESFVPPSNSRSRQALEPDVAYVATVQEATVTVNSPPPRRTLRCFNCNREGHFSNTCSAPRRCFGCGAMGTTRRDCRRCSGNGHRSLGPAGQERRLR